MDNIKNVVGESKRDFQEFVYKNKLIVQGAAFTAGWATKELIESNLNNLFLPLSSWFISQLNIPEKYLILTIPIRNLLWSYFTWIMIILVTFLVLEYIINRQILGMKTKITDKRDAKQFDESKVHS